MDSCVDFLANIYLRDFMNQKAFLAIIAGATMAGSSGVFIKSLEIPATSISFIRTMIPTLLIGIWMMWKEIPFFKGNYKVMLSASILNALRMYLFFTAYIYTSIGNAVIISYTWPIFVTILSVLFLHERVSRREIILLTLAFIGILIVYANKPLSFESRDFIGMTAALGMAAVYAITVVLFKKESSNYSSFELIFYQNCASAFIFLPFIFINEPPPTTTDLTIAGSHAIFLGIIAFSFFFYGLKHLKASTSSMIAYVEIISAICFSVFWQKEALTWNMIVGGACIVFATILLRRSR